MCVKRLPAIFTRNLPKCGVGELSLKRLYECFFGEGDERGRILGIVLCQPLGKECGVGFQALRLQAKPKKANISVCISSLMPRHATLIQTTAGVLFSEVVPLLRWYNSRVTVIIT